MILATHPSYPASRAYVLKLHRDARPRQGRYIGRLENVSTGEQFVFGSAEELLACLARDVRRLQPERGIQCSSNTFPPKPRWW